MEEFIIKIKQESDKIISGLGFEGESIVTQKDRVIMINIQTSDKPSLLIGRGGESLEALQHILRTVLSREIYQNNINVVLDISGYRSKKGEIIEKLARDKAYLVMTTGIEEILPPMSSFERRIVHITCKDISDVETESAGEGRERRVKIRSSKR